MSSKPVTIYNKGTKYLATYIDTKGQQHDIDFIPENTINIVELINQLKEEHTDFYRLYGVVESRNELKEKQYIEQYEEEHILTEDNEIDNFILSNDNFKDYVKDNFKNYNNYIKLIKSDKPNIHQEWGIHVYCYDYETNDSKDIKEGPHYYIPFSLNKDFIDSLIKLCKQGINITYKDSTNLVK